MIKDNQRYLNRLHVVVDAVVTAASYLLAWWLMFGSRFADKEIGVLDMGIYFFRPLFCCARLSDPLLLEQIVYAEACTTPGK